MEHVNLSDQHRATELPRILRMSHLCHFTGLSRSTIYEKLREGGPSFDPGFPRRIRLSGSSAVGFDSRELRSWIDAQIAKREECQA